jgi:hypothetical protein
MDNSRMHGSGGLKFRPLKTGCFQRTPNCVKIVVQSMVTTMLRDKPMRTVYESGHYGLKCIHFPDR